VRAFAQQVHHFQLRNWRHQRQIRSRSANMRPLAVLIGIVMGSAFALFAGLTLTWITLLFVPKDEAGELFGEQNTLIIAISIFGAVSLISAVSFYGQLRERSWRLIAHAATVASLGAAVWLYWPNK
jgi:xanthine/uracil permease